MIGPSPPDGFRVFSAFATFVYSQLQAILPDSFLGDISNWDHFLTIDLSSPNLPYKTVADFLRNKDFADQVAESDLPTPSHFVEQALCFCKNVCILLLKHKLCKSKLVRSFSIFDEAVIRFGEEVDYTHEPEMLCDFFVQQKWVSPAAKPLILSAYWSFVERFKTHDVSYEGEWITFLTNYYKLHCRENLFSIFKLCRLSLSANLIIPPIFTLALEDLQSDVNEFQSCVRSVQSSLFGVPSVSELYSNPRTVSSVFSLLGRGQSLLEDENFTVWDTTSSCSSRRRRLSNQLDPRYACTVSDEEKLWVSLQSSPKKPDSKSVRSPPKFAVPTPIQVGPSATGNSAKNTRKSPVLGTPVVSVTRRVTDIPFLPEVKKGSSKKLVVRKKNVEDK